MMAYVTFAERPATTAEREIAVLLERFVRAMNEKDAEGLWAVLHPDARIEMAGRRSSFYPREEYMAEMRRVWHTIQRVYYHDAIIRLREGDREATVHFRGARQSASDLRWFFSHRYLRCKQTEYSWLIYESGYIV